MSQIADLIIQNGHLMTFDADNPAADAVAVRGKQIVAVGSLEDVGNLRGPDTEVVDAGGGSVLPGFIESHVHLFSGAAGLDGLDLTGVSGPAELSTNVREFAAHRPDDQMVYGSSADYNILGPGIATTRHALDEVMPDRPLALMSPDAHFVWANTKALELAGIFHGREVAEGSEIIMGEDGLATGELQETGAFEPVIALTPLGGRQFLGYTTGEDPDPPASLQARATDLDVMRRGLAHCAAAGITSLHNMDGNFYQLELLDELQQADELLCRTEIPFHLKNYHPLSRIEEAAEMRRRYGSDMLWSRRVKMFMDGVHDSRTAFMLNDYPDRPGNKGEALFSAEQFNQACIDCDKLGLQISVHAIGDAGVRRTLDGYEVARAVNGPRDSRHRIEHIELIHPDDIPRFAELGVIASMQPLHSPQGRFFDPWEPDTVLFDHQLAYSAPWQTLREAGARMIFSSDWPVVPVEPMLGIRAAVDPLPLPAPWVSQRQSLGDTLAAYTCDGAFAEFNEDRKGRLKTGMLADIVVMPVDLAATASEELAAVKPVMTLCGGRITHRA